MSKRTLYHQIIVTGQCGKKKGGGGVYVEEQEEGERVEFSNIWNQSVCKRRGREQGVRMGEGEKRKNRIR